jgi:serine/threonine-protein kinase
VVDKGQLLSERYRLLSLVDEGGMAFVYRAHDQDLDRTVAIKILRPEHDHGDAFRREARAFARLPHPNIVTIYDVAQDGDVSYIVMEYVEGRTLKELVQDEAPLRAGQAIDILCQVCEAVGFAHSKGIIHCDLKPQNVLVLPDGGIKVTDFGIARAFSAGTTEQRGKAWGTPYYASPELISGDPLTPASDVYALGVMFYELLAGARPFDGESAVDIARQHVVNAPPPIQHHNPRVSRYLQRVLDQALAKDPSARYQTAGKLGKALVAYRQQGETSTQPLEPVAAKATAAAIAASPRQTATPAPAKAASRQEHKAGVDWLLLLLAAITFVAVMGLFPLWATVLSRALGPQLFAPTATPPPESDPTVTIATPAVVATSSVMVPTVQAQVTVPDLVGHELAAARQLAEDAGLVLSVDEERHDPEIPVAHVIAQGTGSGSQTPGGSTLSVVVSLGPDSVVLPEMIGFPVAIMRLELEDLGLVPTVTETWSTEPLGLIVGQVPAPGTEVAVGSGVTLTVSGGPVGKVDASFADKVRLATAEFDRESYRPGDVVQLVVMWEVLDRLPESYKVFIHLTDRDGQILAQLDQPPLGGRRPTDRWQPGEKLIDPYLLVLPRDAPLGTYQVRFGLYRGATRLPVLDPGLAQVDGDALILREIEVRAN